MLLMDLMLVQNAACVAFVAINRVNLCELVRMPFCDEPPVIVTGIKYKQLPEEINNVYGMSL